MLLDPLFSGYDNPLSIGDSEKEQSQVRGNATKLLKKVTKLWSFLSNPYFVNGRKKWSGLNLPSQQTTLPGSTALLLQVCFSLPSI